MEAGKKKVVLYSESENFSSLIKYSFENNDDIEIVAVFNNSDDLRRFLVHRMEIVAVVCATKLDEAVIAAIMSILHEYDVSSIAVCDTVDLTFEMLKIGAESAVTLKENSNKYEVQSFLKQFILKVSNTYKIKNLMDNRNLAGKAAAPNQRLIAIGTSTGGTEALLEILKRLPAEVPPILIVQHMPAVFTKMYADRLNEICDMNVWEAKNGDLVKPGLALIAPGDYQMRLVNGRDGLTVKCTKEEKVNGHAPSVDVLFDSVAEVSGSKAIGVILTGMGSDGAKGILKMYQKGAYTIGQDEKTSVVYGMPRVAYELGGISKQSSLERIARDIMEHLKSKE